MRVTFLGSGDALGSGGRFQACLAIRAGPDHLLLDCGASSLVTMRRFGADPAAVDAVIVSHLHGDHFGGIPFLVLAGQFGRRTRPLRIAGPRGVEARVRAAMEVLFPGSSTVERKFALEFLDLHPGREIAIGTVGVTPYEVVHPSGAPALALRLAADGKVLAYSGDTAWTETLLDVARGADVFVCEAYFYEAATGTVTDAVVVAWTDRGPLLDYLGPVSPAGWLVARAVRRAVAEGLGRTSGGSRKTPPMPPLGGGGEAAARTGKTNPRCFGTGRRPDVPTG